MDKDEKTLFLEPTSDMRVCLIEISAGLQKNGAAEIYFERYYSSNLPECSSIANDLLKYNLNQLTRYRESKRTAIFIGTVCLIDILLKGEVEDIFTLFEKYHKDVYKKVKKVCKLYISIRLNSLKEDFTDFDKELDVRQELASFNELESMLFYFLVRYNSVAKVDEWSDEELRRINTLPSLGDENFANYTEGCRHVKRLNEKIIQSFKDKKVLSSDFEVSAINNAIVNSMEKSSLQTDRVKEAVVCFIQGALMQEFSYPYEFDFNETVFNLPKHPEPLYPVYTAFEQSTANIENADPSLVAALYYVSPYIRQLIIDREQTLRASIKRDLERRASKSSSVSEDLVKKFTKLESTATQQETTIKRLEDENHRLTANRATAQKRECALKEKLSAAEAIIKELTAEVERLKSGMPIEPQKVMAEAVSTTEDVKQETTPQERTPEENEAIINDYINNNKLIIAGGNENLINKLVSKYPSVRTINNKDIATCDAALINADAVLTKTDCLSHPFYNKVKDICKKQHVPFRHMCDVANLTRLETVVAEHIVDIKLRGE